ncbi:MAG: GDSL-type esterase/lipase family protein [bacterium]|nr:GDSL-type esterase/lipase family protein [bacterium]
MRILIFGDSIAQGYFDRRGGWANRLAVHYHKQIAANLASNWVEVFNLGISGDTAAGVLSRIRSETESRRLSEDDEWIIIAVGINDAILVENRVVCEIDEFQKTYDAIIKEALLITPRVVCVGLTAVNESETDPWAYSYRGKQWKNNRINLFEDTIKQSAERKEVPFVPIHDKFLTRLQRRELLADGLHPNETGHTLILKRVHQVLSELMKL